MSVRAWSRAAAGCFVSTAPLAVVYEGKGYLVTQCIKLHSKLQPSKIWAKSQQTRVVWEQRQRAPGVERFWIYPVNVEVWYCLVDVNKYFLNFSRLGRFDSVPENRTIYDFIFTRSAGRSLDIIATVIADCCIQGMEQSAVSAHHRRSWTGPSGRSGLGQNGKTWDVIIVVYVYDTRWCVMWYHDPCR